jgi:(p)ppGpp synthase/HD superfamily hydrolase
MQLVTKDELLQSLNESRLNTNSEILRALDVAFNVHNNQLRDSGNSYLEEHIYPLTKQVFLRHKNHFNIDTLLIVCILHDTIEDGDLKDGYLAENFNEEIERYILALTKEHVVLTQRPTQEWLYDQTRRNMEKIEMSGEIPQIVRIEDRLQNLESTISINMNRKEKYLRMLKETEDFYIPLSEKLNVSYGYKTLLSNEIDRINKMLNTPND